MDFLRASKINKDDISFIFNVGTNKLPNGNISRRAHVVKVLAYFKRPFAPMKIAQPDNQPIWAKVALHNEFRSQTRTDDMKLKN